MKDPETRIPVLDGVRGLAILLVLASHTLFVRWPSSSPVDRLLPPFLAGTWGWVGVDLFFVLSGFLITGILLDSRADPKGLRNFYARRVLRIFPLYFAFLAFCFWVLPGDHRTARQPYYWTYTTNLFPALYGTIPTTMGHLWSLCVEEHFYLLWPLLVRGLPVRLLGPVCLLLIAACPLLRFFLRDAGVSYHAVLYLSPCRFDTLAWGALLAWLARREGGLAAWRGRARWVLPAMGLPVGAWLFVHGDFEHAPPAGIASGLTLLGGAFAALLVLLLTAPPGSRAAGLFQKPWLAVFGKYSYAMYLLHTLVARYLPFPTPCIRGSYMPGRILFGALVLAGTVALAWLSWRLLETPFLRLKRRFR